jgi:hypothetical protein
VFVAFAAWGFLVACNGLSRAQDRPAGDSKPTDAGASAEGGVGGLGESEASLERRYQQFERTLLQMAEYLRKTEPERADLLIRAIGRSKENRISQQMEAITQLLKKEQFGDAIGDQEHLVGDLKGLLELLQSEDRRHQLEQEKQYYEMVHKEVSKLVAREKDLRKATERGGNLNRLAERQQGIRNDAQSLLEKIDKQDAGRNGTEGSPNAKRDKNPQSGDKNGKSEKSDKKSGQDQDAKKKADADKNKQADASSKQGQGNSKDDSKDANKKDPNEKDAYKKDQSGDAKKSDAKGDDNQSPSNKSQLKGDKKSGDQRSQKGDSKKSQKQQQQGQQSPGGEEQQEQGEQQQGSPSEQSQPQDQTTPRKTPGRKEIEEARRAMRQAEEELKRLDAKKGTEREDEAIRKLADARAQLEKILRQLREEEQQILLTSLEARFARMLLVQLQIHADTVALNKTPTNAWTAKHFGRSRELSVAEDEIAVEAAKALTLLKEEGSSVAFPQGVEQVRDDMLTIARRLSGNDVGEFTQSMERDVIEALEEMVTALQNEIEKRQKGNENRRSPRGQSGQSDSEKELVQQLAELKMLRSLQFRVNRRTKQIGRLIVGEQAGNDKLLQDLSKLARRQAEIQEATYILATGRNR